MRHPENWAKYKINQRIACHWLNAGIIKGIRFVGEMQTNNYSRETFTTIGWEYQIFRYKPAYENLLGGWEEWGWVTEAEIDKYN